MPVTSPTHPIPASPSPSRPIPTRRAAEPTERERAVLKLMADGLSTREIAMKLAYSERTIKAVLQSLTLRFNLRNRTQAVAYAVRNGWI